MAVLRKLARNLKFLQAPARFGFSPILDSEELVKIDLHFASLSALSTWTCTAAMSTTDFSEYKHLTEDVELQQLYSLAMEARTFSYSPYSKFRVGACLLTPDGKYITGTFTL